MTAVCEFEYRWASMQSEFYRICLTFVWMPDQQMRMRVAKLTTVSHQTHFTGLVCIVNISPVCKVR